jgi:hypothetical protein
MRDRAMDVLVELITRSAPAHGRRPTTQLDEARGKSQMRAQFLLDFVEAENSSASTRPREAARVLGISLDHARLLSWEVMLPTDAEGRPAAPASSFIVALRAAAGTADFRALGDAPLRSLFRGGRAVQEFGSAPPAEYDIVFAFIERPMALFCAACAHPARDEEFEKLYTELRRRPDSRYQSPLYRYLQAVLRTLLLLRPTSESEFEAVLRRLARSARTFGGGATSTHYFDNALRPLLRG